MASVSVEYRVVVNPKLRPKKINTTAPTNIVTDGKTDEYQRYISGATRSKSPNSVAIPTKTMLNPAPMTLRTWSLMAHLRTRTVALNKRIQAIQSYSSEEGAKPSSSGHFSWGLGIPVEFDDAFNVG